MRCSSRCSAERGSSVCFSNCVQGQFRHKSAVCCRWICVYVSQSECVGWRNNMHKQQNVSTVFFFPAASCWYEWQLHPACVHLIVSESHIFNVPMFERHMIDLQCPLKWLMNTSTIFTARRVQII